MSSFSTAKRARAGFGLVEAIVALVLVTGIVVMLAGAAGTGRRLLAEMARDTEEVEAARVARALLEHVARSGQLASNRPGGAAANEVEIDFPVGTAVPCDTLWLWQGIRAPDAGRDSAVVIDRRARMHRVALSRSSSATCAAGPARSMSTSPSVADAVHFTVFEAGVLRVDDAVRYARTGTPRQPLTAASLDRGQSHVRRFDSASATWVDLSVATDSGRSWTRRWRAR